VSNLIFDLLISTTKETAMKSSRRTIVKSMFAAAAITSMPMAWAADVVKIGYVSPQTGPLAPFGEADKWVIEQMKLAFKDGITTVDGGYA